jgi:hypothetical protein
MLVHLLSSLPTTYSVFASLALFLVASCTVTILIAKSSSNRRTGLVKKTKKSLSRRREFTLIDYD